MTFSIYGQIYNSSVNFMSNTTAFDYNEWMDEKFLEYYTSLILTINSFWLIATEKVINGMKIVEEYQTFYDSKLVSDRPTKIILDTFISTSLIWLFIYVLTNRKKYVYPKSKRINELSILLETQQNMTNRWKKKYSNLKNMNGKLKNELKKKGEMYRKNCSILEKDNDNLVLQIEDANDKIEELNERLENTDKKYRTKQTVNLQKALKAKNQELSSLSKSYLQLKGKSVAKDKKIKLIQKVLSSVPKEQDLTDNEYKQKARELGWKSSIRKSIMDIILSSKDKLKIIEGISNSNSKELDMFEKQLEQHGTSVRKSSRLKRKPKVNYCEDSDSDDESDESDGEKNYRL